MCCFGPSGDGHLGEMARKYCVRFSSFAGMIESVCEGAECWESRIAVSGLLQIDSVPGAISPFI